MAAISKLTAVVPVIAKADTFTAKEMEDFKQEIMQVGFRDVRLSCACHETVGLSVCPACCSFVPHHLATQHRPEMPPFFFSFFLFLLVIDVQTPSNFYLS